MTTYVDLTEQWCEAVGLSKFVWNGLISEYWVSLYSADELKKVKKN